MGASHNVHGNAQQLILLAPTVITTAVTGVVSTGTVVAPVLAGMTYLVALGKFVYGSGGTTAKFWIQTSYDQGATWNDIINFPFTTASATKVSAVTAYLAPAAQAGAQTDATLADNSVVNGLLGDRVRVKYTTTGTYGGSTTVSIYAIAKG